MQQIEAFTSGKQGYEAGRNNRLNPFQIGAGLNENAIPREQVDRLRQQSWKLFRDNTAARKIIRTLESKVVGRFPKPQPQTTLKNGDPHLEYRRRAVELWKAVYKELDYRGKPGRGGQHLVDIHKNALRATVLGGEVLPRFRYLTRREQRSRGLTIPLKLQLIHADRLDETLISDRIFYGIEFDDDEQREAYHILNAHPSDPRMNARRGSTIRVPASEMTHLYASEDVDQIRGVPWFASLLLPMRNTRSYEDTEIQAALQAACVVLGYRRSNGQTGFGLQGGNTGLTDMNGNAVTNMQPGMLLDLGQTGAIESFDPQRPNANLNNFIQHMQRTQAAGVPGIKGSTLTGDYKNSSFSSERAADNDTWPEIEGVQDWFFSSFSQPVYENVIIAGVQSGFFDGVKGFSARDFQERKENYLSANWQGPVSKSIKPSEDENASRLRKSGGRSSPQREAAAAGVDLEETMAEMRDFIESARSKGLPEQWIMSTIGVDSSPVSVDEDDDDSQETKKPATEEAFTNA